MAYLVKEIFYSLQGEGAHAGRPAVFLRFAGCNLWSGREEDRAEAVCEFCDTDFLGTDGRNGGRYEKAADLAEALRALWPAGGSVSGLETPEPGMDGAGTAGAGTAGAESTIARPYIVCTGGEPLLQLDTMLIDALHAASCEIAVETNGTLPAPEDVDWLCVSPKADAELAQRRGDELKLVWPQEGLDPVELAQLDFTHFFLQPKDGPERERNTRLALDYCLAHPRWRLSLQIHKILGID